MKYLIFLLLITNIFCMPKLPNPVISMENPVAFYDEGFLNETRIGMGGLISQPYTIYYTLDGSTPIPEVSEEYRDYAIPIITTTTLIRAISTKAGYENSNISFLKAVLLDTVPLPFRDTIITFDTLEVKDSIFIRDTITIHDTLIVKDFIIVLDTILIQDTIIIHDTLYIKTGITGLQKSTSTDITALGHYLQEHDLLGRNIK